MSFRGGKPKFGSSRPSFGGRSNFDQGPPAEIVEMGEFLHDCEGEMVCRSINEKVPYFNAPIYLENKSVIGKVEEILGPINERYFTVKVGEGVVAKSFKVNAKVYIGSDKLLPLDRFLPKPKSQKIKKPDGAKGGRGRGGMRGGRGGSRGGSRGGFSSRGGRGGASNGFRGGRGGSSSGFRGGRGRGGK